MKIKLTTTLEPELIEELKIQAVKEGKRLNELLDEILRNYLKKNKK